MAYLTPKVRLSKDNILQIHHPDLAGVETYLTANLSATGTALTVKSNEGFTNGDILLYEKYGDSAAELKAVDAAVTSGTSMTSTAVTYAHSIDCPVYKALWNQVEISGAATATGSKTTIATVNLTVTEPYTEYVVASTTYSYYFVRFVNGSTYSSYSDALVSTDFAPMTVGFIRRCAFENVDQPFEDKFTADWVYDQMYQCEADTLKMKDRWSSLVELDYDLGALSTGLNRIALPSDIEDKQTNKAVLGFRISGKENMEYVGPGDWQRLMQNVQYTTLASTAAVGATTLILTDSADFEDSGTVMIAGTDYTYTTNTRSTNTLSGLTALTAEITAAANVWQGATDGEPRRYTVNDGYVYFDVPVSSDWNGMNCWLDYYKTAQRYDSDGDTVLMNDPNLYISYLEASIKKKKGNGEISPNDNSVKDYERRKTLLALKDKNPNPSRIVPDVPNVLHRRPFSWWRG